MVATGGKSIIYNVTELDLNSYKCSDRGLILPLISEYTWPIWVRAVLYFVFLLYLFLGIAKIADVFMTGIEQITATKKRIKYTNYKGEEEFIEKNVWNGTVANLTLMALGSSCPEILLAIIEIVGNRFLAGELGPGTIVGSAAYNLLIISGLCVVAIASPNVLRIENFTVFLMTTFWSVFAYIWLFLVLSVISPDVVDLWEAILTLSFFAVLVILSYMAEKNFYIGKKDNSEESNTQIPADFDLKELKTFIKYLDAYDLKDNEREKLMQKYLSPTVHHSSLSYRIKASRQLTGSRIGFYSMRPELLEIYHEIENKMRRNEGAANDANDALLPISECAKLNKKPHYAYIEFSSPVYLVSRNQKQCTLTIVRSNYSVDNISVKITTKDGSALAERDYEPLDYVEHVIPSGQKETKIKIDLMDSFTEDKNAKIFFFVNISINEEDDLRRWAKHGKNKSCMVMIAPHSYHSTGEIEFSQQTLNVNESEKEAVVSIIRREGAVGRASVIVETYNITATDRTDYTGFKGKEVVFEEGEIEKDITITILDDKCKETSEQFGVRLVSSEGASLGNYKNIIVTILDDDEISTKFRDAMRKLKIDPDYIRAQKLSWVDQFSRAANVNEGDTENANVFDYVMHVISFPWKIMFAFVPPPGIWNGWLCFFVSLCVIGVLTALVGDAAAIFGCCINLKDSITAISFVAMGTSLPDTFASFISCQNEKTADNAIGNVTGSNSVNVFLGLGLPWVLAAVYWQFKGLPFTVKAGDLSFSIIIFSICCVLCITTLILRRYLGFFGKGELGGPKIPNSLLEYFLHYYGFSIS